MRKALNAKREKFKWLSALCVCLLCFTLCLGLLAQPTLADAPMFLDDLDRIGANRWDDTNVGPKKDSFGDTHAASYAFGAAFNEIGAGVLGFARYKLDNKPEGKFAAISGRIACADASTADAAMRLKIYGDNEGAEPIYTSPVIQRGTRPFEFRVDLRGQKTMKIELVQISNPGLPEGEISSAFALVSELMLIHEPAPHLPAALFKLIPLDSSWVMAPLTHAGAVGGPGPFFGSKLGGTLDASGAMGVMGAARYQLDKKYATFSGKLACAADSAGDAVMQVKLYADGSAAAFYTSPPIKRSTAAFDFSVSVSGVNVLKIELVGTTDPKAAQSPLYGGALLCDAMLALAAPEPTTSTTVVPSALNKYYYSVPGYLGLYIVFNTQPVIPSTPLYMPVPSGEYVYSFTRKPDTDVLLPVYAKYGPSQVADMDDITILKYYGSFNNLDLVLVSQKGISYPAVEQSITLGGHTFKVPSVGTLMVNAAEHLYPLAAAFDVQGLLRAEDIAAIAALFNAAALPTLPTLTAAQELAIKQNFLRWPSKYYVHVLKNNVYFALQPNGTYDAGDAVWLGPDGKFNTADDKVAVLREGSYFYEETPGVWKFLVSQFDYADIRWASAVQPTTATTAPSTSTSEATSTTEVTSTTDGFLTTKEQTGPPKTGVPASLGLMVCVALLFMGCAYCGYRLVRKEHA